jgi:hypothetical protein
MKKLILIFFCIATAIWANAQNLLYVDSAVSGTGTSWASAFKSLNEALAVANYDGIFTRYEIRIAKGTYYPTKIQSGTRSDSTFLIGRGGIAIFGGYPTGGGARNVNTNPVVLSGAIGGPTIADNSMHVMVVVGIDSTQDSVVLDGLNFTNGNADSAFLWTYNGEQLFNRNGAAMYNYKVAARKLLISNCAFTQNSVIGRGGAIYNEKAAPVFANCRFDSNSADDSGGGVSTQNLLWPGPGLVFDHCVFTNNIAKVGNAQSGGGGVHEESHLSKPPTFINCIFIGNAAGGSGGGIFCISGESPLYGLRAPMRGCSFTSNRSNVRGGGAAFYFTGMHFRVDSCTFEGNISSSGTGGGLWAGGATVNIHCEIDRCSFISDTADQGGGFYSPIQVFASNCMFHENVAQNGGGMVFGNSEPGSRIWNNSYRGNYAIQSGGGLYSANGTLPDTVSGCLFSGNKANFCGGGLCNSNSKVRLINCTFAGDTATFGNGIANMNHSSPLILNSILWEGAGRNIADSNSSDTVRYSLVQGGATGVGNISANPAFLLPASNTLAPTIQGDYHLTDCSPIDNGDGHPYIGIVDLDDAPRVHGAKVDMGAYEYQGGVPCSTTAVNAAKSNGLSVVVSPNPVSGIGYLNLTLPKDGDYIVEVFDITGRMLQNFSSQGRSGNQRISFNAGDYAPGMYVMRLCWQGHYSTSIPWVKE